jgi:ATP-dependent RNA helicase SUPV3L1/SUV3
MIEEAKVLGAAPQLRIDAVKSLQQRWQAEAQTVPLDRKQEQKLWDAFRKPIDDAFQRKTEDRERAGFGRSSEPRPRGARSVQGAGGQRQRRCVVLAAAVSATGAMVAGQQAPAARVVPVAIAALPAPTRAVTVAHRPAVSATVLRVSKIAARALAMRPSAPSAKRSSAPTWRCASSRRRRMAKR